MNRGKKIALVLLIIFFLFLSFLSSEDLHSQILLSIPPGIVAHPSGVPIVLSSPILSSYPSKTAVEGEGYAGYFECNMPATLTYQANSPHRSVESESDVIPAVYTVRLYDYGGDDHFYTSPEIENSQILPLPGSSSIESGTGKIFADLKVNAEVGWEHHSGKYEAVFVITAIQTGGITVEEVNLYKSFFNERGLPESDIIAQETDPNLYFGEDVFLSSIFIGEGAGYKNRTGYFLFGETQEPISGTVSVIYENASMSGSGGTLLPGDTRPIGVISSDYNMGFWLQSNGYNNPSAPTYYSFDNSNSDSLRHTAIFSDTLRERIIIGWEDLPNGGDKDYNDVLFALDISPFSALDLSNIPDVNDLVYPETINE